MIPVLQGISPEIRDYHHRNRQFLNFFPETAKFGGLQSCQVSRFTRESPGFRADLQVSRLVLKISRIPLKWSFMHGLAPPPQVCWANKASRTIFASQSGNIGL